MKPRHLYLALFTHYAFSGGRFTAPFLQHELQMSQSLIGIVLAFQTLAGSIGSWRFGILADEWNARRGSGLWILFLGVGISSAAVWLHGVGVWMGGGEAGSVRMLAYHSVLRCVYAVGVSATGPVLNGMTLLQLKRDGRDANDFGKERLYGAVSWGAANALLGPVMDTYWGFKAIYGMTMISFVVCSVTIYMYAKDETLFSYENFGSGLEIVGDEDGEPEPKHVVEGSYGPLNSTSSNSNVSIDENLSNGIHEITIDCNESNKSPTQKPFTLSFLMQTLSHESPLLNFSYILALFALYIGMSVVENLIFLYFEFLGGSNTLCGLTVAVTVLFELPLFHYAPNILKWMNSPVSMFQWGCLAYVIRVIGYSLIPQSHAKWVLVLEPLHGFTIGFVLTGSVAFVDGLMPAGYESSGQGFLSCITGLGQFVGLCIGAVLEGRVLYRVLAGIVSIGSAVLEIGSCTNVQSTLGENHPIDDGLQMPKMNGTHFKRKCSDLIEATTNNQI